MQLPITYFEYETRQPEPPVWPLPSLGENYPIVARPGKQWGTVELTYGKFVPKPRMVPVLACGHGEIAFATDDKLIIEHARGYTTNYANLDIVLAEPRSMRARNAAPRVKRGDVVAYVAAHKTLAFEIGRHENKRTYSPHHFGPHIRNWTFVAWTEPANEQVNELPQQVAA